MDVNLTDVYCCQAGCRADQNQRSGKIVNVVVASRRSWQS